MFLLSGYTGCHCLRKLYILISGKVFLNKSNKKDLLVRSNTVKLSVQNALWRQQSSEDYSIVHNLCFWSVVARHALDVSEIQAAPCIKYSSYIWLCGFSLSSALLIVSKLIKHANLRQFSQPFRNEVTNTHLMVQWAHTTEQGVLFVGENKPTSKSNIHKHNFKIKAITSIYDSLSPFFPSKKKIQEDVFRTGNKNLAHIKRKNT